MDKMMSWWKKRNTPVEKSLPVPKKSESKIKPEKTQKETSRLLKEEDQHRNRCYAEEKANTLIEIKRSSELLESYKNRLEKEQIEKEFEEKQPITIRKSYKSK